MRGAVIAWLAMRGVFAVVYRDVGSGTVFSLVHFARGGWVSLADWGCVRFTFCLGPLADFGLMVVGRGCGGFVALGPDCFVG